VEGSKKFECVVPSILPARRCAGLYTAKRLCRILTPEHSPLRAAHLQALDAAVRDVSARHPGARGKSLPAGTGFPEIRFRGA